MAILPFSVEITPTDTAALHRRDPFHSSENKTTQVSPLPFPQPPYHKHGMHSSSTASPEQHNSLQDDPSLDRPSLMDLIKCCARRKDLIRARKVYADVVEKRLFPNDVSIGNALVSMFAKCGALYKAQELFDQLPVRDAVSWTSLISAYAKHGLGKKALSCFRGMRDEGLSPDSITFICILKVCGTLRRQDLGEEIYDEVTRRGLLKKDVVLGTAFVDMYAKCSALQKAQEVFDKLPARNVVSWTALICGYAQHGFSNQALNCFMQMQDEGISPNAVTFICILKACSGTPFLDIGQAIHAKVKKDGLFGKDVVLGTALVDMYAKCGALKQAQEVFDQLPERNVVSWNALITGYVQHGLGDIALNCYARMRQDGHFPTSVTFICILKACGCAGSLEIGEAIHAEVQKEGLFVKDTMIGTALVDMYAKCGVIEKAQEVFDELPARDVVAWNALMAGYVQHELGHKAVSCFMKMCNGGLHPNVVTFICMLKACGNIGSLEMGEEIHEEVQKQGLLEKNIMLGTAVVDMYAKCGVLGKAQKLFGELPRHNVVSWTALIAGYAQLGETERALDLFNDMVSEGTVPDVVTFLVLLSSCSHAGRVEEGQMLFDDMENVYCLKPTLEHYACMVDLFSRAGHFEKALVAIEKVPPSDCLQLWLDLLGACRKWLNVELGRWAFEQLVKLDEKCVTAYIYMGNIYAAAGMQEEASDIEAQRLKNGAWSIPGCCWWTDASKNVVHTFTGGNINHPQSTHIYAKLEDIRQKLILVGYSPRLHWVSQSISGNIKNEEVLCGHGEKLAIACALINTSQGTTIRITKNIRICDDCHFATSLISKMEKRKIQVRDPNRIHIFEEGRCICGE